MLSLTPTTTNSLAQYTVISALNFLFLNITAILWQTDIFKESRLLTVTVQIARRRTAFHSYCRVIGTLLHTTEIRFTYLFGSACPLSITTVCSSEKPKSGIEITTPFSETLTSIQEFDIIA